MAAWAQRWKPLQLLITISLLFLTNQFEVRGDVLEKLSWDMAAELHTRGTSEIQELLQISSSSVMSKQLMQNHRDLDAFLVDFNKETMEDWWQSVSEISASVRQKVLVLTGSTDPSEGKMRQENILDPQKRVPVSLKFLNNQSCVSELDGITEGEILVQNRQSGSGGSGSLPENLTLKLEPEAAADFSLHGNTTLNSGGHLPKAALVHGPKEPNQENPPVYKVTNESDPVCRSRSTEGADEAILEFDQQQILMLEDDEVVRRAAASLYEKHPTVSSVHLVGPQQRLQQVKGQALVLSEHSSLVLVGHGARDHSGEMRVSGYTYQDVARIIQSISRTSEKIQTTTVLACDAGSDRRFREALLKKLHEAGIETELHLWTAVVQVTETGEVISQDVSAGGVQWRSEDQTKKVVLTVGRNGEIRRKESDHTGHQVLTNHTRFLGKIDRFQKYRNSWPTDPTRFVPLEVFNSIFDQLEENVMVLEGLIWGLFHSDQTKPGKVDLNNFNIENYVVVKKDKNRIKWVNVKTNVENLLSKCYEIKSGKDIRNIINHFAKDGEDEITYLMVNGWIYEVNPQNLYVYLVGKKQSDDQNRRTDELKQSIQVQMDKESYPQIKKGLRSSGNENIEEECADYFRGIFFGNQPVRINPITAEAWCTTYFVASVIAESSRNFRTFPLILMALDMTTKGKYVNNGLSFLFDEHSMTRGGSWIDPSRRGFTGSATPEGSSKLENNSPKTEEELLTDLKNVLYREDIMFTKWKQTLGEVIGYETYVDKMAKIAEDFNVFNPKKFKNGCNFFGKKWQKPLQKRGKQVG